MNFSGTFQLSSTGSEVTQGDGERRNYPDRRRRPTPMLSRYTFRGRRRRTRRATDPQWNYYVDRPGARAWAAAIVLFLLSCFDAFFTLYLLDRGGYELNPFMRAVLGYGRTHFMVVKYALTGFGVLVLLIHKNFYLWWKWLTVKRIVLLFVAMYAVLVAYELVLIF